MRPTLAVALLALLGLGLAGCGSSAKAGSGPITVAGSTTISSVSVGTLIRCKGGPAARVPRWFGPAYLRTPGVAGLIRLKHRHDGSVTVACTPR